MTPQINTIESLGYVQTKHSGVYQSTNVIAGNLLVLSANDLQDSAHNVWLKLQVKKMKN